MSSKEKVMLAVGLAIAVACWAYVWGSRTDRTTRYSTSTYSAGPWGCKALYLTLAELKLPVTRYRQSFRRLKNHKGVLVITGPLRVPIGDREKTAVREWIEAGNHLVVCDGPLSTPLTRIKGARDTGKKNRLRLPRLTSPSRFLHVRLKEFPDTARKGLLAPLPHMDASARISISGQSRWKKPPKDWSTLIKDDAGPILITRNEGKGSVTALSDATLASNLHVSEEQNLRLILALIVAQGRPGEILFDEFHQGHAAEQTLWMYVGSSILAWVLVQGVLGVGLFFFSKRAQYVGRYRSLESPQGRSSLEYVDSMAGVYESCKAGSLALEAILNRFLARLSRRTGLPLKRLIETSPDRIVTLSANGQEDLAGLISRCSNTVKAGRNPPEALELAQQLALARRSMRGFEQNERLRR